MQGTTHLDIQAQAQASAKIRNPSKVFLFLYFLILFILIGSPWEDGGMRCLRIWIEVLDFGGPPFSLPPSLAPGWRLPQQHPSYLRYLSALDSHYHKRPKRAEPELQSKPIYGEPSHALLSPWVAFGSTNGFYEDLKLCESGFFLFFLFLFLPVPSHFSTSRFLPIYRWWSRLLIGGYTLLDFYAPKSTISCPRSIPVSLLARLEVKIAFRNSN